MLEKTFLTGKADYLESSIARMTQALSDRGFELDFSRWLHPVPHVHSVHVKSRDCPALFANGKGISDKASQASALGEFIERLGTLYLFADYFLGQAPMGFVYHPREKRLALADFDRTQVLTPDLWSLYDPHGEVTAQHLVSLQDSSEMITAIPLQDSVDGHEVYFPVNLLNTLYASNGLAAGNTLVEASIQALSEIYERWVRSQILRHGWVLPVMPASVWQSFATVVEAAAALAAQGIELDIRDASLGGAYPVVCIILRDVTDGRTFVSFGAHPIYEVALERTLTEAMQGRDFAARDGFEYPLADAALAASDENLEAHFIDASGRWHLKFFAREGADFDAVPWNLDGDLDAQWQSMLTRLQEQGFKLYHHSHDALSVPVVRLVVPGMSEIYPMQDMVDGNANRGLPLRWALDAVDWQRDRSLEQLLDLLEVEAYPAHMRLSNLIGLLPDPGTPWDGITVAELRLGCLLWLGAYEDAQRALGEVFSIGRDQPVYQALDMALTLMLEDRLETEGAALVVLFGEETWAQLVAWLDGESFLWDMELANPFAWSARHQALCASHRKLCQALHSAIDG